MSNVFANTQDQGKYAEAEAEYKEVIELEENVLGPEHRDSSMPVIESCLPIRAARKARESKAFAERAVKSAAKRFGRERSFITREYAKFLEELQGGHAPRACR